MRRPLPPPRPSAEEDRRRTLPWLVSAAIHVAVAVWWATLPEPAPRERAPEPSLRPIELIELPTIAQAPTVETPPPIAPPDTPPSEVTPAPPPEAPAADPSTPRAPRAPGVSGNAAGPSSAAVDPPATPLPGGVGGLALSGLRDQSQPSTQSTSRRPSLPPPPRLGGSQVVRRTGAAGLDAVPRRDGPVRSLGEAGFRPRRNGKLVFRDTAGRFKATLSADGRVHFKDLPVAIGRDPNTGRVKMGMPGLAEGVRAAQGQELYQQEKRRLLEETFELRLRMAVDFAVDKIDRRLASLYRELLEQWGKSDRTDAERRVDLFRRWDECEEGLSVRLPGFDGAASSELDDLRRSAGEQARETIERFIRRQLPPGSPQAFTEAELRRLNASRDSKARFSPYR